MVVVAFCLSGYSEISVTEKSSAVKDSISESITTKNADVIQFAGGNFSVLKK